MRPALSALLAALLLAAPPLAAQDGPLPERRLVQAADVDLPGGDLAMLFDTTVEACQRACLADAACVAYTFNTRSNACFPKGAAADPVPFAGAVSGWLRETAAGAQAAATGRAAALDFLVSADLDAARRQAERLGAVHAPGLWTAEEHLAAAAQARAAGDPGRAVGHVGAAVALTDAADLWVEYGRLLRNLPETDWTARRALQERALNAAVNAYLRGGTAPVRASAAVLLAEALEGYGRGRAMIPALRLAQAEQPRDEVAAMLATAIGRYGFRITEHRVDNAPATPRICAVFSEDLMAAGVDYTPFVQLPVTGLAVEAEGAQLCIEGVRHGERYSVTFREGLPAASGEVLAASVRLDLYVRDRPAAVRFPGRGFVLPAAGPAAVPVETVNTERLDLVLRRVSDRNLVAAMREGLFARPLSAWQEEVLAEGMAEEVWRGTAEVATELNRDVTSRLPVADIAGPMPPGVYVLRAAIPGTEPWDTPAASQWFTVSDLGLTTLWGADGLHVVVRALSDAGPVPGAEVRLVSRANRVLGTAVTDAQGYAVFPVGLARGTGGAAPALVTVALGGAEDAAPEDFAFLSLTEPEFDLGDRGVAGREAPPPVDVFLTTDRGAYRAGETVHVTALARDGAMRAIDGLPLTLRLRRPDGVEYSRTVADNAGAGGHVGALQIAGNAPRGLWRLDVLADPMAPPLATASFLVEDFLPERIDFDLALQDGPVRLGDAPMLDVDVRYLFGAAGADLAVEGEVILRARDALPDWPGFAFGRHDGPVRPVIEPLPFGTRTDAEGRARLRAQLPEAADPGRPLEMVARVRVSEGSGRPVEREIVAPVLPDAPVIGLRALFDGAVAEGAEAGFQLVVADATDAAVPARLRWVLNHVETRYQWYQLFGEWNWEPMTRRTRVAEGELSLDAAPGTLSLPVGAGRHELVVERLDGPPAAASVAFTAGWYATGDAVETPDMLEAALDAPAYAVGDTAVLRVVPQRAGVALVTVMSDRLIDLQIVELGAGEARIPLKVSEDWGTGAYVAASLLHPTDGARAAGPARALGLAHAAVDPGDRRLRAALELPEEATPRAPMTALLRVEGAAPGETVTATVAAVDVGILNLTGFDSPDPEGHYFGQRRLGVAVRDLYGRLIDGTAGALGVVRSGGDGGLAPGLQAPPPTEELLAWFSGPVTLGPDGTAALEVPLPAFNGTVRLMAVVWSSRAVGQAQAEVLVRDPVVVQAALPRFLAPGDESRLLLELTHATGPEGRVGLDVTATGGLALGPVPSGLDLAEGGRARVEIPVTALAPGLDRISVAVTTPGGAVLTRTLALPVQVNDPVLARTSRFSLPPGESFALDDAAFAGLRPGAFATLAVGPLARFDAAGLLALLDRYPYGCTEQVTAAAMPLLDMAELAEVMGLGHADDLRTRVDMAVAAVLLNQSSAGGFGLWMPSSGDLWLDAFVTDFLSRARAQGHAVPEPAFRAALDNLRNQLAYAPDFDEGGAPWAYALMVLAREGAAAVGDLRYYADVKAAAFDTPLAAAQLGAALASYGDQTRADAMFAGALALVQAAEPETPVWRADYGTRLRDAAGLLTLAVQSGSAAVDRDALADRVAEGLAAAGGQVSTQEAVWALMAAHALVDRPGAEGVTLDGAPMAGPLARLPAGVQAVLRNGSDRAVQVTLTAFGVPEDPEPAGGAGYRIERRYVTLEGAPADPASVAAGTRLVVVLEVIPLQDRRARLMIDDALPAGFEIDNPDLLRGGDIGALTGLGLLEGVEHAEFRQERFLAAVDWSGTERFRLGYVVRAVSPGSFHHPAASVEDMYRPALRGRTAPGRVGVTE